MALSASTVWECRPTTGSANNGGGFVAGATGTDFSQQGAAQVPYTDLVIGATNTQLTSAANPFTSAHVGNILNVTGGTGFTTGRYQVVSVATNVATMDRAVGTATSTGGTGNLGGALDTLATLSSFYVSGNKAFVKAETYSSAATTTLTTNTLLIEGYSSTRGDNGQVTLTLATNTGLTGLALNASTMLLRNFIINCSSLGTSTGISSSGSNISLYNCKVMNFTSNGVNFSANTGFLVAYCEVTGGGSAATAALNIGRSFTKVFGCYVHDNACTGISLGGAGGTAVQFCLIANNTGASHHGITGLGSTPNFITNNTIYGNGGDGINGNLFANSGTAMTCILDNIIANNGGWGINNTGTAIPAEPTFDGNAYYSNTSGNRNGIDDTTGVNGVASYTNVFDQILSVSPFTNAAGGDFTLNNTAGGGAACRSSGRPGTLPGYGQQGYLDMGVLQAQATTSTYLGGPQQMMVYWDG